MYLNNIASKKPKQRLKELVIFFLYLHDFGRDVEKMAYSNIK